MLNLLFFIFIFTGVILLIAVSVLWRFIRSILGLAGKNKPQSSNSKDSEQPTSKAKIFDKAEGEYVDYEEIKE
jgi:hypothetical protein